MKCEDCKQENGHKVWCDIYEAEERAKGDEYYNKSPANMAQTEKDALRELEEVYGEELEELKQVFDNETNTDI